MSCLTVNPVHSKLQNGFVLDKQPFQRSSSGSLIVKLRIYGHICHWKLSVPFKNQTFAMSYYTELRCSSFFSTVKCNFSNSMVWELLTNAECWFFISEITLLLLTLSLFGFKFIHCSVWVLSLLIHCWYLFLGTT